MVSEFKQIKAINVCIAGATGYAGEELISILLCHPHARVVGVFSRSDTPMPIEEIYPKFKNRTNLKCQQLEIAGMLKADLIFLALPHTASMEFVPRLLAKGKRVIDLSADYRLKNSRVYEAAYKHKHTDALNLRKAVYGLPELYRLNIKKASLVANPGCYPTAAILAVAPLLALGMAEPDSIIIDAKSGVTGAGRKAGDAFFYSEINEDFRAYKINNHQHMPEINQELSKLNRDKVEVTFVPHLLPINRGILETIYVRKNNKATKSPRDKVTGSRIIEIYKRFYKSEPFVRVRAEGDFPKIKDVVGTNFCDIGIKEEKDKVIIVSAIDNLVKGAAGQAVQNMNIMCGFPEAAGL